MIHIRNLTLAYNRRPAVHHLNTTIAAGSLTAIVGPNGSGKSTLLKGIAELLEPSEGEIVLKGVSTQQIGYLPQHPTFDLQFPMSIRDFVGFGRVASRGLFRGLDQSDHTVIDHAIEEVQLREIEDKNLDTLSGGQLQRARFARLSAQQAPLLLLDEPFSHLDPRTTLDLTYLVKRWHREGKTILLVIHEIELARQLCPDALLIAREEIARGPSDLILTTANLERAHQALHASSSPHWCEGPHDHP